MNHDEPTRSAVTAWMVLNLDEHRDARTGIVNLTALAEAAAGAYGIDDEGGPLDDPEHWIWEAAIEAAGEQ
jgi:hypothetical protein